MGRGARSFWPNVRPHEAQIVRTLVIPWDRRSSTMVRRFAARCLICGLGGEHVVGRHGAADTLEFKIANCLDCDSLLNSQQNTGADQDLPRFGFVAKPRCNVGDGSYR